MKTELCNALKRGLYGTTKKNLPYCIPVQMNSEIKARSGPNDPPPSPRGVRIFGNTADDIQKLLLNIRKMNFSLGEQGFEAYPEYLEVSLGKGRYVEVVHEQTPGLTVCNTNSTNTN